MCMTAGKVLEKSLGKATLVTTATTKYDISDLTGKKKKPLAACSSWEAVQQGMTMSSPPTGARCVSSETAKLQKSTKYKQSLSLKVMFDKLVKKNFFDV